MAVSIDEAYASTYCYELMLEGRDSEYCSEVNTQVNSFPEASEINEEYKGNNIDIEA